jgi:hypothetical protein
MKRIVACLLCLGLGAAVLPGCSDTSTAKQETTIKTPEGTTTTTVEKKVEKSGENPPPAP